MNITLPCTRSPSELLAAAGLSGFGGMLQARFLPSNAEEANRLAAAGIKDAGYKYCRGGAAHAHREIDAAFRTRRRLRRRDLAVRDQADARAGLAHLGYELLVAED